MRIEAFADPEPVFDAVPEDVSAEIDALIDAASERSERELMDEVFRRVTITLCRPCYLVWIENPAGA